MITPANIQFLIVCWMEWNSLIGSRALIAKIK